MWPSNSNFSITSRQLGVAVDVGAQMLRDVARVIEQLVKTQPVPVEELLTSGLP